MQTKQDLPYLQHILEAIEVVEDYIRDKSWEEFRRDRRTQDSVIRQITIIGEACNRISLSLQQAHPTIPWSSIIGMRHKLVHDYFRVDLVVVWQTAQNRLPPLKAQIQHLIEELDETS